MTATTHSAEDGSSDPTAATQTSQTSAPEAGANASLLVGMGSADRCANCGAEMAVDQRYCVECGVRRGRPRFSVARPGDAAASTAVVPQGASSPRFIATLVAVGLVIALLALGVGVLIGHDGKQAVHVTVSGATGTAGTGSSQSSGGGSTAKPKSNSSTNSSTAPTKTTFFGS